MAGLLDSIEGNRPVHPERLAEMFAVLGERGFASVPFEQADASGVEGRGALIRWKERTGERSAFVIWRSEATVVPFPAVPGLPPSSQDVSTSQLSAIHRA